MSAKCHKWGCFRREVITISSRTEAEKLRRGEVRHILVSRHKTELGASRAADYDRSRYIYRRLKPGEAYADTRVRR
jgi:hypothetical protein